MATPMPRKVNPGDLITASYINQLIDALSGLDQRLSNLEQAGTVTNPVRITGYVATQPVHVGDQIEIDGSGFLVPAVLNQVTIGGVQVTDLSSGLNTTTKLFVPVPSIPGATDSGIPVSVTVTNANGTATSPFQILVRSVSTAPKGRTELLYDTPPVMPVAQPNITPGQVYTFGLRLTAVTDRAGNYAITPTISGAGWSAQLVDASPMPVPAGAAVPVRVSVTAGSGTGTLSLSAVETTPGTGVTPGNAQVTITAGAPPPTPETRIRVTLAGATSGATVTGTGVTFTRDSLGFVGFTVLFTEEGDYTASAAMRAPTGWVQGTTSGSSIHVNPVPAGTTTPSTVGVQFTAGTGAVDTDLVLTVTRPADGVSVSYALPVTIA